MGLHLCVEWALVKVNDGSASIGLDRIGRICQPKKIWRRQQQQWTASKKRWTGCLIYCLQFDKNTNERSFNRIPQSAVSFFPLAQSRIKALWIEYTQVTAASQPAMHDTSSQCVLILIMNLDAIYQIKQRVNYFVVNCVIPIGETEATSVGIVFASFFSLSLAFF